MKPVFPVGELPQELILNIADFLPPASRASFALTCREIRRLLGDRAFQVGEDNVLELLGLLEKDGEYPQQIVCPECKCFHYPCAPYKLTLRRDNMSSVNTQHEAMSLVAAILRKNRQGLDNIGPHLFDEQFFTSTAGVHTYRETTAKVIDGRLLLKTERLLTPPKYIGSIPKRDQIGCL